MEGHHIRGVTYVAGCLLLFTGIGLFIGYGATSTTLSDNLMEVTMTCTGLTTTLGAVSLTVNGTLVTGPSVGSEVTMLVLKNGVLSDLPPLYEDYATGRNVTVFQNLCCRELTPIIPKLCTVPNAVSRPCIIPWWPS